MRHRSQPLSPSGQPTRQRASYHPRLPSFWGVLLIVLSGATVLNIYTCNHRKLKFRHVHEGEAKSGARPGNKTFPLTLSPPVTTKNENPLVPAAFEELDVASGGGGSGGGGVRGSDSGGSPEAVVGGGGDRREYPVTAVVGGGGGAGGVGGDGVGVVFGGGTGTGTGTGGGSAGVGGTREEGWTSKQQPPLPLGRDTPLQISVLPATMNGGGVLGFTNSNDDFLHWRGEDGHRLPNQEVGFFPCSLTEAEEYPTMANNMPQNQHSTLPVSNSCLISCSQPSSDKGKELHKTEGGVAEGGGGGEGRGSAFGADDIPSKYEYCGRALRACALYQECTHVLLPPASPQEGFPVQETALRSGGMKAKPPTQLHPTFAILLHAPKMDGSMAAVEAAASAAEAGGGGGGGWGGNKLGFTFKERPRTYYVVSFGGSGSKMLGGWLSERGKGMVKEVFHIHDPRPADKLFVKEARRGVKPGRTGRGMDFRGYDFPEGDFPASGKAVEDIDSYRVVLIFKDPAEALVSRYFYNHCKNLKGADCGGSEKAFPSLERYAEEKVDRLHMESFYDNYCDPGTVAGRRNFPVVCVNYHKLWDNKEAVVKALGLPVEEAKKLPERTETIRNDQTSARNREPFTLAVRERLRIKHASLSEKVFQAPAVAVV